MEDTYSVIGFNGQKETTIARNVTFQEAIEFSVDNDALYDKINITEEYELLYKAENVLVVSDCNMMLQETKNLLVRPEELKEQFVFLGNFICKGTNFYGFMSYLSELKRSMGENCVFVRGKNEHNLLAYINKTKDYIGEERDVQRMVDSIEASLTFSVFTLEQKFPEFFNILSGSLPFYENDQYILVSGGMDLSSGKWRDSAPAQFFQTDEDFLIAKNDTGKTIVFGTRTVQSLHPNGITRPWIKDASGKIAINGDCKNLGKLFALLIHGDDRCFINVSHHATRRISYAY